MSERLAVADFIVVSWSDNGIVSEKYFEINLLGSVRESDSVIESERLTTDDFCTVSWSASGIVSDRET